jgi:hypothetical protein
MSRVKELSLGRCEGVLESFGGFASVVGIPCVLSATDVAGVSCMCREVPRVMLVCLVRRLARFGRFPFLPFELLSEKKPNHGGFHVLEGSPWRTNRSRLSSLISLLVLATRRMRCVCDFWPDGVV